MSASFELMHTPDKRVKNTLNVNKKVREKRDDIYCFFSPKAESPLFSVNSHNTFTTERRPKEREKMKN